MEDTFGVAVTPTRGVRVQSVEPNIDRQPIFDETIEDFLPPDAVGGPLKVGLSMELVARPNQITEILQALMGSSTVTSTSEDVYKWDFTLGTPQSMTVEVGDPYETLQIYGVGVNSVEFTFEAREFVKMSVDCIAKNYKQSSFSEPTYSNDKPFVFYEAQLRVDGSKVAGTKSVSLTVDRGIADDEYVLDDFTLNALRPERTEITGRMTLTEDEIAELRRALYGSTTASSIGPTNDVGSVQLTIVCDRGDYQLKLNAPIAVYTTGSYSVSGRDRIDREIEFKVVGDFTITLVNNVPEV